MWVTAKQVQGESEENTETCTSIQCPGFGSDCVIAVKLQMWKTQGALPPDPRHCVVLFSSTCGVPPSTAWSLFFTCGVPPSTGVVPFEAEE